MCPKLESGVEGTPDMKYMGIFSENRAEWFITELACCSDSIVIVPVAVETQFMNATRILGIINKTELQTICVSSATLNVILEFVSKEKLPFLKNIIHFDPVDQGQLAKVATCDIKLFNF